MTVGVLIIIVTMFAVNACLLTTATVAKVRRSRNRKHSTTTVQLRVDAKEVYTTLVRILEETPEVGIDERDDENYTVKATKGKRHLTGKVEQRYAGMSHVRIKIDAPDAKKSEEDLSLKAVKVLCEELGVEYTVVDE
jgi:hypothetical protein